MGAVIVEPVRQVLDDAFLLVYEGHRELFPKGIEAPSNIKRELRGPYFTLSNSTDGFRQKLTWQDVIVDFFLTGGDSSQSLYYRVDPHYSRDHFTWLKSRDTKIGNALFEEYHSEASCFQLHNSRKTQIWSEEDIFRFIVKHMRLE